MTERYRRDLRCTIADFSVGRNPRYEIDTFATPEGTLGIKLLPAVEIGLVKEHTTRISTNIYWFCKHLEESGYLVKECYIGEAPQKPLKISVRPKNTPSGNIYISDTNLLNIGWRVSEPSVYIVVRKIDESDIETTPKKRKK